MNQTTLDLAGLGPKDLVLTPNRRLSAWLQRDYNQLKLEQGLQAWGSLNAMPLDSWLGAQYDALALVFTGEQPLPRLLSPQQSRLLWQLHLKQAMEEGTDQEGMVQLCIQARNLISRWELPEAEWNTGETEENRVFGAAHMAYLGQLEAEHWIDGAGLFGFLQRQGQLTSAVPLRVFLHGFNDQSEPQLNSVVRWLQSAGIRVQYSGQQICQSTPHTIAFSEHRQQFKQALIWALDQHQQNPHGRYAIVVPNLQQQRLLLEKHCLDLASANPHALPTDWHNVINITAGLPLSGYSLCSHLQLLLQSIGTPLQLKEWEVLLKSPFFQGGLHQFQLRDQFCIWLRDQNRPQLSIQQLQGRWGQWAEKAGLDSDARHLGVLALNEKISGQAKFRKSIRQWLLWFQHTLKQCGWLHGFTLDSENYQINSRLLDTLQAMQDLDGFIGELSFNEFQQELNTQLKNTTFQPQTETAPIQIMGVLEAASLNFNGLWVCECESQQWPQPAVSNSALPRQTLRKYNMPGSGPDRELEYARVVLNGFRHSAPIVVFSWGQYQGDSQLLLSPLLEDLPDTEAATTSLNVESREQRVYRHRNLISSEPADAVGLPLEASRSKGGSGLIKSQSLCPFKAYAEYRLGIKPADELQDGVKASDRGTLVHRVLETFWRQMERFSELERLLQQEDTLNTCLNDILDRELLRFKEEVYLQPDALYELERQRAFKAVRRWLLEAEQGRTRFIIDKVEKRQSIQLAGLELSVTADRIDQLEDGSRIIIDYKTGLKKTASLMGERPEEPQLPLYALLDEESTKGICFGVVRPDKSEWQGLLDSDAAFTEGKCRTMMVPDEGWQQQMNSWRTALEALAQEYIQGVARVAPLNPNTCQYCHLGPLCRIKEHHRDSE